MLVPLERPPTRIGLDSDAASTQGPFVVSWYWYLVTVAPPEAPGAKLIARVPSPVEMTETAGAPGTSGVVMVEP